MTRIPDTAPLEQPVSRSEVAAFRTAQTTNWRWDDKAGLATGGAIVFAALFGLLPLALVALIDLGPAGQDVPALARTGPPIALLVGVLWLYLVRRGAWRAWERRLRIDRFARTNGLTYTEATDAPQFPGSLFQLGDAREKFAFFRMADDPATEFGNHRWTTGFGNYQTIHLIGYVAIRVGGTAPRILLDGGVTTGLFATPLLSRVPRPDPAVPLGGGAVLVCAPRHAAAARQVFTPDVLAQLTAPESRLDVEVVDEWVFLYSAAPFDWLDPAVWTRLASVSGLVADRVREVFGGSDDDPVRR